MKNLEGEYFKKNKLKLISDIDFCGEIEIYKKKGIYYISIENVGDFGIKYCSIEFSKDKMLKFIDLLNKKILIQVKAI